MVCSHKLLWDPSWQDPIGAFFDQPYMEALKVFLLREEKQGKIIYPPPSQRFQALRATPFDRVKVVVVGQDPYHGPGQAHGLSFSVPEGVRPPPSLRNIFKELKEDLGMSMPKQGNLMPWAQQGVLLLNSVLTVEAGHPASHHNQGWERFTDQIIQTLNEQKEHLVFMLWGSYAIKKGQHIDTQKHRVLQSPHPSPLSAYQSFWGSKPFSQCNHYLRQCHKEPIDFDLERMKP